MRPDSNNPKSTTNPSSPYTPWEHKIYNDSPLRWGGRIGRKQYVMNGFIIYLGTMVTAFTVGGCIGFGGAVLGVRHVSPSLTTIAGTLIGTIGLAFQVNNGLKRLRDSHDPSVPGWLFAISFFIPIIGTLAFLYLALVPSRNAPSLNASVEAA